MKFYQRILLLLTLAVFLLLLLGGAGGFLMSSLFHDLGEAWTLVSVAARELSDTGPGLGEFHGRLVAPAAPRSPSGRSCAVWEATANWRYGHRDSVFCKLHGAGTPLLLSKGNLTVPIVLDEEVAPRATGPYDRLHPWRTLSLEAAEMPLSGENIPPVMDELCAITPRSRQAHSTYYREVCLTPSIELYVIGCRSGRGLSACDREMILSANSRRQLAQDRLTDMRAGLRLGFGLLNLMGLLLLGGLFHKLYPVPEPSSALADRKVPRADGGS